VGVNPYILLALVAAILAAGAGGFKLGADHEVASQKRLDDQVRKVEKAVQATNAELIASLRPKYTTIQNKLEKQIETNTVYRDCKLDGVGLQLVNQALTGDTTGSGGKLPAPDTPAK
jgi:uncharacterized protein HemX